MANNDSQVCNPLLKSNGPSDSGLPLILGINLGFAICVLIIFGLMHIFLKFFIMIAVKNKKKHPIQNEGHSSTSISTSITVSEEERGGEGGNPEDRKRKRGSIFKIGRDYCKAIAKFFLMSESEVLVRSGPDASLYLIMHLYLLVLLVVFSFFSIVIILPINYLAGDIELSRPFVRTTVANLSGESKALWSHVLFSILYVIIAGGFMIHYSLRLGKLQKKKSSHTVMIYGIPKFIHVEDLLQHFEEALPGSKVIDIRFAYNIKDLQKKWNKLKKVSVSLQLVEAYEAENGEPKMIRQSPCDFNDQNKVNAKEFYLTKVDDLKVSVAMERNNALTKKLPIAFVTFAKPVVSKRFVDSYKLCRHKPESSLSDNINSSSWDLSLSPFSQDLLWENLSLHPGLWWIRWLLINLIMVIFLIFFTTPPVIINSSEEVWLFVQKKAGNLNITLKNATGYGVPAFVQSYASSFLALILGNILLFFITRSVFLEYHWSKSRRDQTMLRKAFIFLALQILILPSLGLTSLSAVAALLVRHDEVAVDNQLSCVFLPNNGTYFITFVIIATFVHAPLELLRLPQLAEYIYRSFKAESKLEKQKISHKIYIRYDFKIGIQYATSLVIFTLTVSYSLATPIIVPCGVLFFAVKYLVDKYNLLYGYKPAYVCGRQYLHKSAMKLVMVGMVHLQLVTLFYSIVREGKVKPRSIIMMITVSITSLVLFGLLVLGWFSYLLPKMRLRFNKNYSIFGYDEDENEENVEPGEYIAPVLQETSDKDAVDEALGEVEHDVTGANVSQSYESFGRTIAGGRIKLSPNRSVQQDILSNEKIPLLVEEEDEEEEIKREEEDGETRDEDGETRDEDGGQSITGSDYSDI